MEHRQSALSEELLTIHLEQKIDRPLGELQFSTCTILRGGNSQESLGGQRYNTYRVNGKIPQLDRSPQRTSDS